MTLLLAPRLRVLALALGCAALGCDETVPATETVVQVDASPITRELAASVVVEVISEDGDKTLAPPDGAVAFDAGGGPARWPLSVPVVPRDGDAARRFAVRVTLLDETGRFLAKLEHVAGFEKRRRVTEPTKFLDRCLYRDCPGGFTCEPTDCDGGTADTCVPTRCVAVCEEGAEASPSRACPQGTVLEGAFVDAGMGTDAPGDACLSAATPCKTLSYAWAEYVATGRATIVNVAGGDADYAGLELIPESGTEAAPVVVRAWPGRGSAPVLDVDGTQEGVVFFPESAPDVVTMEYVTFEGLELTGARTAGVLLPPGTANVEIRHCYIHDNGAGVGSPGLSNAGVLLAGGTRDHRIVGNVLRANNDAEEPDEIYDGTGVALQALPGVLPEDLPAPDANTAIVLNALVSHRAAGVGIVRATNASVRWNRLYENEDFGVIVFPTAEGNVTEADNCTGATADACPPPD